jgi:hypothetical protein
MAAAYREAISGAAWRQSMAASNGGKRNKSGDSAESGMRRIGRRSWPWRRNRNNNGGGAMAWRRRKRERNIAAKWRREWWLSHGEISVIIGESMAASAENLGGIYERN